MVISASAFSVPRSVPRKFREKISETVVLIGGSAIPRFSEERYTEKITLGVMHGAGNRNGGVRLNETQKRLRRQFVLPNEIFDLGLSGGEILVYAFLIRCEDRETYTCYPSYDTIGSAVGMSRNTVGKYVSLLERKGLIETEPTFFTSKDGKKRNGNLLFRILPIQDVIDARFQRALRKAEHDRAVQEYDRKHPRKEAT